MRTPLLNAPSCGGRSFFYNTSRGFDACRIRERVTIYVDHLIQSLIDIVADARIIIGLLAHLERYVTSVFRDGYCIHINGHAPGRIRPDDKSLPATRSPHIPRVHVRGSL